jgi:predicted PP-loop superfamily ATPase
MYSPKRVSEVISRVRRGLGLSQLHDPEVTATHFDPRSGTLLVITSDRPDKSAVLGHGGWVSSRLKAELGVEHLGVRAQTDLYLKRFRVRRAIRRLKGLAPKLGSEVREMVTTRLIPMLENELLYPDRRLYEVESLREHGCVVGFSGGVDSASALIILLKAGLNPVAVTVNPGTWLVPSATRRTIDGMVEGLGVEHHYLDKSEGYHDVFKSALEGRFHPCGKCHPLTESRVIDFAVENRIPIVSFGDLLSTGGYSSSITRGILRFNPAAALALTKLDTALLARQFGHPGTKYVFGCPLLKEVFKLHPEKRFPSISRVLRETRAGVLDPGQALKYIESIIQREV